MGVPDSASAETGWAARVRVEHRRRLLVAAVEIVANDGYVQATVGSIAKRAGVSRATLYEHFAGKEECFLTAHREQAERLGATLVARVAGVQPQAAVREMVAGLAEYANSEPAAFTFLTHRAIAAGPRGWAERDRLIDRLERMVERSWEGAHHDTPAFAIAVRFLLEGCVRLLSVTIRRDGHISGPLLADMLAWIDAYRLPTRVPRWNSLVARTQAPARPPGPPAVPRPAARGRCRVERESARGVQLEQMTYGTVEAVCAKGFNDVSVADIAAHAGVSRDVFYAHFNDKQDAFEQAARLVFEQIMASVAGVYFYCTDDWREQIWQAGRAFLRFLEANPTQSRFLFLGSNAPLPLLDRVDDLVQAFTIFIEGGYHCSHSAERVPRMVADALVCSILEAATCHVRGERVPELRRTMPVIAYMVLAPFVGLEEAARFVEAKATTAGEERGGVQEGNLPKLTRSTPSATATIP